jgi:hypothetical protein
MLFRTRSGHFAVRAARTSISGHGLAKAFGFQLKHPQKMTPSETLNFSDQSGSSNHHAAWATFACLAFTPERHLKMRKIGLMHFTAVLAFVLGTSASHANFADSAPVGKRGWISAVSGSPDKPPKQTKAKAKKKVKAGQSARYRPDPRDNYGSRETEGQRSERLSRECRGAVNAGACAGYTR